MKGLRGYIISGTIFILLFASLASLGLSNMPGLSSFMSAASESGFSGEGITGAVVSAVEEPPAEESKPANLLNVAILLIGLSFIVSLFAINIINKKSKYRA